MNQPPLDRAGLDRLLAKLVDEALTEEERTRLERLLSNYPAARRHYFQYLDLHAELVARLDRAGATPQIQPAGASLVLGFLGQAGTMLHRPVLWSFLGVGFLFCVYVAIITWGIRDRSPLVPHAPEVASEGAVATITYADDRSRLTVASTHAIEPGEALTIDSGVVQLKLKRGATLLVEGPARWSVDGDNRATLTEGKLVANVPPGALGFTLATSSATIVDFGTEFGVLIDSTGASEVQVFEGRVEIQSTGSEPNVPTVRLTRGQKVIVSGDSKAPIVRHSATPADVQRFQWAKSSMPGVARQIEAAKSQLDWTPIALQSATADHSQANTLDVAAAIDDNVSNTNGWGIADLSDSSTNARTAVFETVADAIVNRYTITLSNLYQDGMHTLGKFRISVTTDPRDTFADGQSNEGDVTANWIELMPITATATDGTTLTINRDNSILASGANPNSSVYTVTAISPLLKVTGFRLEALTDPALPTDGPGRAFNGNFVLTEFQVEAAAEPDGKPSK